MTSQFKINARQNTILRSFLYLCKVLTLNIYFTLILLSIICSEKFISATENFSQQNRTEKRINYLNVSVCKITLIFLKAKCFVHHIFHRRLIFTLSKSFKEYVSCLETTLLMYLKGLLTSSIKGQTFPLSIMRHIPQKVGWTVTEFFGKVLKEQGTIELVIMLLKQWRKFCLFARTKYFTLLNRTSWVIK